MDYTEITRRLAGDRRHGLLPVNRRALGAVALIHTGPMAILFACLALLSCHVILA